MRLTITRIDRRAGAVTLSDGSRWHVGPLDRRVFAAWRPGHRVTLSQPGPARALRNDDLATGALAAPAEPPGAPAADGGAEFERAGQESR